MVWMKVWSVLTGVVGACSVSWAAVLCPGWGDVVALLEQPMQKAVVKSPETAGAVLCIILQKRSILSVSQKINIRTIYRTLRVKPGCL